MAKDFSHEFKVTQCLKPQHAASTPSPTVIDTQGFESTVFIIEIGDIGSSATMNCHFHEGASSSPTGDVVAADLEIYEWTTGVAVAADHFHADDTVIEPGVWVIQYKGDPSLYRYVVPVPTIATEHYDMSIICIQKYARYPPR